MSPREQQRRSFAYGNTKIENPVVTREMVDMAADRIDAAKQPVTALVAAANRAEKLGEALWDDIGHGYVICHVCQVLHPNCPKAAEVYKIGERVTHRDGCPLAETEVSG